MSDHWDFVRESNERITQLNNELLALEREPDDEEAMRNVFRIAHTLKGNFGAAGFDVASDLAHAIEDLLEAARAGRIDVTPELMDVVFDAVDELEAMVREVEASGELTADPEPTIRSIRAYLERETRSGATTVDPLSAAEIDTVLSSLDPPAADDYDAYLVRFAVQESGTDDVTSGGLVVDALIDAFDVLGTDPSREAIEAGRYGGQLDVVFAGAVGDSSIAAALEPIDEIADFEIVDVTDRFDASADIDDAGSTDLAAEAAISTDEARDLEVDELLEAFDEYDDLDEKVREVEGDDDLEVFDEMGDAGSFDDLFDGADVEPEIDPDESESPTDDAQATQEPATEDDVSTETDDVDDAETVFAELKEEVDPVGFDELQDELADLEFDEFGEEEIGMDELLGDDLDESLEHEASETDVPLESGPADADEALEDDLTGFDELFEGGEDDGDELFEGGEDDGDDDAVGDESTRDVGVVDDELAADEPVEPVTGDHEESEDATPEPAEPVTGDHEESEDATPEPAFTETPSADGFETDPPERGEPTEQATWDDEATERPLWDDPVADDPSLASESEATEQSTPTAEPDDTAVVEDAFTFDDIAIDDDDADGAADSSADGPSSPSDERVDEPSDEWVEAGDDEPDLEDAESLAPSTDDPADEGVQPTTEDVIDDASDGERDEPESIDEPAGVGDHGFGVPDDEPADPSVGGPTLEDEWDASAHENLEASPSLSDDRFDPEAFEADEAAFDVGSFDATADTDAWADPEPDDASGFDDASEFDDASGFDDASDLDVSFDPTPETEVPFDDESNRVSFESSDQPVDERTPDEESDVDTRASLERDDALENAQTDELEEPGAETLQEEATDELEQAESNVETDRETAEPDSAVESTSFDDEFGDVPTEVFELEDDSSDSFEETFGADALSGVDSADRWKTAADSTSASSEEAGDSATADAEPPRVIEEPTLEIPDIPVPESVDRTGDEPTADEIQSVRVDVEQIDDLLNLVEGLVTTRVRLRHAVETELDREVLETEIDGLEKLVADLQGTVMDVRLVPLETIANRLPRVVRDVAREQEKEVAFEMDGTDVELDRGILDRLRDPLIHLVRNAVDHGIEPPADRETAGKPREGRIDVSASRDRDQVTITVSDDGRGLDPDDLRSEAVETGVLEADEAAALTDDEAYDLAFHPGLSTADEVTDVSGRGVGMDVVERTIDSLEGTISIDSELGEGTTVTMTLPVSIAIDDVLFVESGGEVFGVPTTAVHDVESVAEIEVVDGERVLPVEDHAYPVIELDDALETPTGGSDGGMLIRVREDVRPVALQCDRIGDQQEVVVKPFDGFMADIPGLSGATVRGRGEVVPILDVTTL